mmetsp:Transcript_23173/g.47295  ORF Transcript_23173/g.47295 Transcript_23173/m.47295 type:complete len:97 (+) Transcript_23173:164-454(+)
MPQLLSRRYEMVVGQIDRGADLAWISLFPSQKEVLLPPMCSLVAELGELQLLVCSQFERKGRSGEAAVIEAEEKVCGGNRGLSCALLRHDGEVKTR